MSKKTEQLKLVEFEIVDDGGESHLIPLEEGFGEITLTPAQKGIFARVGQRLRGWFTTKTSVADDEHSTDMGNQQSVAAAMGTGISSAYYQQTKEENTRLARYRDYEKMDSECTELTRALSVTVSNVFASRKGGDESYVVRSSDPSTENIINDLDTRVEMQEILPEICRSLLKYGDEFEEVVVDNSLLVTRLKWLNQKNMYRIEDEYGRLSYDKAYVMKQDGSADEIPFKPWQVMHLRHDHQRGETYGRGFFFAARKPWRQLSMMEDGLVLTRMVRSTDRMVFTIPIPKGANEIEVRRILDTAKKHLKRRSVVDSSTGKLDVRKSPLTDDEDIFIASHVDNPARVEKLTASSVLGQLTDVEYFQNKMFMSTGTPKTYLGIERDVNSKATLQWEDIEYGRLLRSIQKEMAAFQRRLYHLQLLLQGKPFDRKAFEIIYPAISFIDEEMRIGILKLKWEIAALAIGLNVPMDWVLRNILDLDDSDVGEIFAAMTPVQQSPGFVAPTQGIPVENIDLASVRHRVFADARLTRSIRELKDMIAVVQSSGLARPAVF
jgi:hypothetical protein